MDLKEKTKRELYEEVKELYYNKGLSVKELAAKFAKSERTIFRWLKKVKQGIPSMSFKSTRKKGRSKVYSPEIFNRIVEIKEELPQRTATLVHRILKEESPTNCPSLSTIRKFIRDKGLTHKPKYQKQGYIRFERQHPNDLWQIDIAGKQTVGHLNQLYLIALIDDCSRYIVAAEYFTSQKGENALKIIRNAIIVHGRPNEILADRGTQFKNLIGSLGTKYSKMLESLDIKPIFASPYHPQTKGKLERWFGVVKQMYLIEARHHVKNHPDCKLINFNEMFNRWVKWYNTEKPHRSLPNKGPPAKIFFDSENRIYRPLKSKVNWNRWLHELNQRKVTKCNEIFYKAQTFQIPPGYVGSRIDVIEYEDKIELYYKDQLITTHPYNLPENPMDIGKKTRKIRKNGTITYKGQSFTIDYKLAGKTVEVQESNLGRKLLVYLKGILVKTYNL